MEIGAGSGGLTRPLADVAGRLTAVEVDPELAARLRRAFARRPQVTMVEADFLETPLPRGSWRAFGNIPFAHDADPATPAGRSARPPGAGRSPAAVRGGTQAGRGPSRDRALDRVGAVVGTHAGAARSSAFVVLVRKAFDRGLPRDARPADLDVWDWVAAFDIARSRDV